MSSPLPKYFDPYVALLLNVSKELVSENIKEIKFLLAASSKQKGPDLKREELDSIKDGVTLFYHMFYWYDELPPSSMVIEVMTLIGRNDLAKRIRERETGLSASRVGDGYDCDASGINTA